MFIFSGGRGTARAPTLLAAVAITYAPRRVRTTATRRGAAAALFCTCTAHTISRTEHCSGGCQHVAA